MIAGAGVLSVVLVALFIRGAVLQVGLLEQLRGLFVDGETDVAIRFEPDEVKPGATKEGVRPKRSPPDRPRREPEHGTETIKVEFRDQPQPDEPAPPTEQRSSPFELKKGELIELHLQLRARHPLLPHGPPEGQTMKQAVLARVLLILPRLLDRAAFSNRLRYDLHKERTRGTVTYSKGRGVRWEVLTPKKASYQIKGEAVTVWDPELANANPYQRSMRRARSRSFIYATLLLTREEKWLQKHFVVGLHKASRRDSPLLHRGRACFNGLHGRGVPLLSLTLHARAKAAELENGGVVINPITGKVCTIRLQGKTKAGTKWTSTIDLDPPKATISLSKLKQPTGIAACDDYIATGMRCWPKYQKVGSFLSGLVKTHGAATKAARSAEAKRAMAGKCKRSLEVVKVRIATGNCGP